MSDRRHPPKRSGEFLAARIARRVRGPQSNHDFRELFADDASCRLYLGALRWQFGFCCPRCRRKTQAASSDQGFLLCPLCQMVCSPTTGTMLDRSPLPLRSWLRAIWELISTETGADLARLRAVLPVSRDELVLSWLDVMRDVFARIWERPLRGAVELAKVPVEVTYRRNGRERTGHCMVAVAVESRGRDIMGGVRAQLLKRVDATEMMAFVRAAVAEGSCVRTSNWRGYARLRAQGYGHIILGEPENDQNALMLAQQVASILRLWLWSSRAQQHDRLGYYLAEFNFRYNARLRYATNDRAAMFNEILRMALLDESEERLRARHWVG